jgi:predicted AAA+ superfamily ATPase
MYPRLYDKKIEPSKYYSDYIETYVERDVRNLTNIGDVNKFRTFIKLCAGRIGQVLNMASLANDAGVSAPTIKSWLSILESSYILFQLYPYHNNFNKRLTKATKIYFYDAGLACNLLGLKDKVQLNEHFLKGALFENAIIVELMKAKYNKGERPEFYYWRESNGAEIDLLMEVGTQLNRVEIKYSNTFDSSFMKNISIFNSLDKTPKGNNYLILGKHEYQKRSNVEIVGWNQLEMIKE